MDTGARHGWRSAACGAFSIALAAAAAASPPPGRSMASTMGAGNASSSPALHHGAERPEGLRLDLRAPTEMAFASVETESATAAATRLATADAALRTRLEEQLPSLGSDGVRTLSRAQELAQRFRREGLPVARLFESRSALVSLGLNQRGKLGIWLIQKLP